MNEIIIGNVKGEAGKINYGYLNILEHPTGTIERLPIIIAKGNEEGPVFWLTANIHGNEYTGIPVIHRVINKIDINKLKGTIIAIPSLNPSGSRTKSRYPYFDKKDPNRLFPDGNPFKKSSKKNYDKIVDISYDEKKNKSELKVKSETQIEIAVKKEEEITDPLSIYDKDEKFPSIQELIWKNLFEVIKETADYLIDLHNAYIHSIPFIFLDRVLYVEREGKNNSDEAKKLFDETFEMATKFGFTIVRETTPKRYVQKKLHRSTSGAALNYLRIPSFTVELGMYLDVEEEVVNAAEIGIFNVLKWAGMIEGKIEEISNIPVVAKSKAVRYVGHPRMKESAVIEMKVKKGDFVKKGDVIAIARDIFGRELPSNGKIITEIDGYVFMINEGILRYKNEEICWIAAEDVRPMIDKWPK